MRKHNYYTRETVELSPSKLDVQKCILQWNLSNMDVTLGTRPKYFLYLSS